MTALDNWTIRIFEPRDGKGGLMFYACDGEVSWGPFNSEAEAWQWLKDSGPDGEHTSH